MDTWSAQNIALSIHKFLIDSDGTVRIGSLLELLSGIGTLAVSVGAYVNRKTISPWLKAGFSRCVTILRRVRSFALIGLKFISPPQDFNILALDDSSWPVFDIEEIKGSSRILVIDDANVKQIPQVARLIARGFKVEHMKAMGVKSIDLESSYDLLILDVYGVKDKFGNQDGLSILEMVRRDNPWIPIIIWSSFIADISGPQMRNAEKFFDNILDKQIAFNELETSILNLLSHSRTLQHFKNRVNASPYQGETATEVQAPDSGAANRRDFSDVTEIDRVRKIHKMAKSIQTNTRWMKTTS